MMLHWLQQTGHRPVALMGGGTTMIGDPSFKDEARKLLTVGGYRAEHRRHQARTSPLISTSARPDATP